MMMMMIMMMMMMKGGRGVVARSIDEGGPRGDALRNAGEAVVRGNGCEFTQPSTRRSLTNTELGGERRITCR